jgi:hypothetical protein
VPDAVSASRSHATTERHFCAGDRPLDTTRLKGSDPCATGEPSDTEPVSVGGVLRWIVLHPWHAVGRRWNYKAAVLSSIMRAALFCATNLSAGSDAALAAMTTEFCFRFATSGFYGAMTQAFRRVEPVHAGTVAAMVVLPSISHSLEFLVHWWRDTAVLGVSIVASILLTAFSTTFNLFAMRRGALIVGRDRRSLFSDLAAMPRLFAQFVAIAARRLVRACA